MPTPSEVSAQRDQIQRMVMAWAAIFLLVLIIVALIASLASELMRKLGLGGFNRILGAFVGLARGGVVLIAVALGVGLTNLPQSSSQAWSCPPASGQAERRLARQSQVDYEPDFQHFLQSLP